MMKTLRRKAVYFLLVCGVAAIITLCGCNSGQSKGKSGGSFSGFKNWINELDEDVSWPDTGPKKSKKDKLFYRSENLNKDNSL